MGPKKGQASVYSAEDLGEDPFARGPARPKPPARKQNIVKSGNAGSSKPDIVPGEPVAPPPLFRSSICPASSPQLRELTASLRCSGRVQDSDIVAHGTVPEGEMGPAQRGSEEGRVGSVECECDLAT